MTIERPFKTAYDFEHLRKVLMRETKEGPTPIIELVADDEIMSEAAGFDFPAGRRNELMNAGSSASPELIQLGIKYLDMCLAFSKAVGYDYVFAIPIVPAPRTQMLLKENPRQDGKIRLWQNEHSGLITSRGEFEEFPWPSTDTVSIFPVDYEATKMPPGMKVLVFYNGIFEDLKLLMGFENMAIKSIEEPDLLDDILERLTALAEHTVEKAAAHPGAGAIFYADDMGFNNGLMLSPSFMKQHVIPRIKRIADACHKHGKPFLLHSCGKIDAILNELIDDVGIDALHSFQDNIEPVESMYKKYGDRVSILGGLDVDLLSRGTPEEVRARTRRILEACAPGGGYCMGSGNSVTNFCKIENYYAMLDETRKWNEEHGYHA